MAWSTLDRLRISAVRPCCWRVARRGECGCVSTSGAQHRAAEHVFDAVSSTSSRTTLCLSTVWQCMWSDFCRHRTKHEPVMRSLTCPQCGAIIHRSFCTGQNAHAFPLWQCRPARPLRDTSEDNVPTLDYRLPKIALIGLRKEVSSVRTQVMSVVLRSVSSVNTGQWTTVNFWRCPVEIDDPPAHQCVTHDSAAPPKCSRRGVDSSGSSGQIIFFLFRGIQSLFNIESDLNCITSAPFFHFLFRKGTRSFRDNEISNLFSLYFSFS